MLSLVLTLVSVFALLILAVLMLMSRSTPWMQKLHFTVLIISVTSFILVLSASNSPIEYRVDIILNRVLFFTVPFITIAIYMVFRGMYRKSETSDLYAYLFSFVIAPIALTSFVVDDIVYPMDSDIEFSLVRGSLYIPYLVISMTPVVYSIVRSQAVATNLSGIRKSRLQVTYASLAVATVGLIITNIIIPFTTDDSSTASIAPLWILIWVSGIYYATIKFRLFGVKYLSSKFFFVISGAVILYLFFVVGNWIHVNIWGSQYSPEEVSFGLIISALFFALLQVLISYIQGGLDQRLGLNDPTQSVALQKFINKLSTTLSFDEIYDDTSTILANFLDVNEVSLVVETEGADGDLLHYGSEELDLEGMAEIIDIAEGDSDLIVFDELEQMIEVGILAMGVKSHEEMLKLRERMLKGGLNAIMPLSSELGVRGVLLVHSRYTDEAWQITEVNLLKNITAQASQALARSGLYEKVNQFNQTLQQKVDEATAELEIRYDELKAVRERERDMMDIMGHELRTPLSIIKITLGALKMKAEKEKENFEAKVFLDAYPKLNTAIKREIELLETMLTSTKIDASKMEFNLEDVDMHDVVEDSILGHKERADSKGLEVNFHEDKGEYHAFVDKVRIGEVIDNIVSNAVKYTEEGHVDIELSSTEDDMIHIVVSDTGPGIPKRALNRLGEKFYRVKQYIEGEDGVTREIVRPGGTGLGLYVTFNLIKLMKGRYKVESEVGKGTAVHVWLPKYVGQEKVLKADKGKNLFDRMGFSEEK